MVYDLIVSGAGPVGCQLASLSATKGCKVLLLEEHQDIGEPIQCAGLVTERALELGETGTDCVLKEIEGARILGPNMEELVLSHPQKKVLAIDRSVFDRQLGDKAIASGAEVRTGTRVKDITVTEKNFTVLLQNGSEEKSRYIAGCDGPSSLVRKKLGLEKQKVTLAGVEVEAHTTWDDDRVVVRTSPSIAPGFFAWAIPLGNGRSRVGLAVEPTRAEFSAKAYLQKIIDKPALLNIPPFTVNKWLGGGIPLSPPTKASKGRGLLVGDSASQVKATSGGGVVMGLRCAQHASDSIIDAMENDGDIRTYDHCWRSDIGKELRRDWALHSYHARMSEKEQSKTLQRLSSEKSLEKINRLGDIDYPSKLVLPLLLGNPGLVKILPGIAWRYLFP